MRGPETERSHQRRIESGFYARFMQGGGLDIGYRGTLKDAEPVLETAIGVDLDYPGYDGKHLPFEDHSQDFVFSSHCLEHIDNWKTAIAEWFRVLKIGGHLIICVPHQWLYERKENLPSRFNEDHRRFYTPRKLISQIELSIDVQSYRLRLCRDNDEGFIYGTPPEEHASGAYEIECVIQKI